MGPSQPGLSAVGGPAARIRKIAPCLCATGPPATEARQALRIRHWTWQMAHTRRILTSELPESALGAAQGRAEGAAQASGQGLSMVSPEFRAGRDTAGGEVSP